VAYRSQARYGPADHPGRARPGTGWGDHSGHWPRTTSTRPGGAAQRPAYRPQPAALLDLDDSDDDARPRRSRFAKLVLLLGLLAVIGAGTLAWGWRLVHDSYPASVTLPAQLAGLVMVDKPQQGDDLENVVAGVATGKGVKEALAGVYTKPDGTGTVYVVVASGLFLRPDRQLAATMTEFAALGFSVTATSPVDAGSAGGVARCATGSLGPPPGAGNSPAPIASSPAPAASAAPAGSTAPTPAPDGANAAAGVLLCGWADHGSVGVLGMPAGADQAAAATLLRSIRQAAVTH
jgi:hypothetical protein